MSLTFEWLQRRPSRNGGWPTFTLFVKVGAEPAARAPDGYEYGKGRWTRYVRSGERYRSRVGDRRTHRTGGSGLDGSLAVSQFRLVLVIRYAAFRGFCLSSAP